MRWIHRARLRWRSLLRRRQLDRDLEEELRFHLDMLGGQRPDSQKQFGNVTRLKETCREMWSLGAIETWWQDFRYALRVMRQNSVFTTVAIATLALAIGANTAIFSVVSGVMLRSLPYRDSARLAMLWTSVPSDHADESSSSIPNYLDWQSQAGTFEGLAFYATGQGPLLDPTDRVAPETVLVADVSPNFFGVLGVSPAIGRGFSDSEAAHREHVVVVSHRLWMNRLAAATDVLGQSVDLDGLPYQVIGVMPDSFGFPAKDIQLWKPAASAGWWARYGTSRGRSAVRVVGRLSPTSTFSQAQAEMNAIAARQETEYPESNAGRRVRVVPLQAQVLGTSVPFLMTVLFGAVILVLLSACMNVANLLLARSAARQREFALRTALGAGRVRLIRQILTESVVLALAGACLGLPLAAWGVQSLAALGPRNIPRLDEVRIDGVVLVFTLAVTVVAGILFGLAPALKLLRRDAPDSIAVQNRTSSAAAGAPMARRALVIAQFSLAMILLTGAGLLIRSFVNVLSVDPGIHSRHVFTMELNTRRDDAFYAEVMDRIRAIPGVQAVGTINDIFFQRDEKAMGGSTLLEVEGRPREPRDHWKPLVITPNGGDVFQVLGIRLIKGRLFSERDDEKAPLVVVINEALARRFWPGEDPVGKRFKGLWPPDAWVTVIGLVQDVRNLGLENQAASQMFAPPKQFKPGGTLVIRATMPTAQLAGNVRSTIHTMDRQAALGKISTIEEQLFEQTASRHFQSWLMGLFSAIALLLAGVGIYGLLPYSVAQRTQEIGVRMALGARSADVLLMVVREGLAMAIAGVLLGAAAAFALTRAISSLLFGVSPGDPLTFSLVAVLLSVVAAIACFIPARRATHADPMVALRHE